MEKSKARISRKYSLRISGLTAEAYSRKGECAKAATDRGSEKRLTLGWGDAEKTERNWGKEKN